MICVLCRYELPNDQAQLADYGSWITDEGIKQILQLEGLREIRAYRDCGTTGERTTGIMLFEDLRSALNVASSDIWRDFMTNMSRWGCTEVELSVLEPSPLLPLPMYPESSKS